MLFGIMVGTNIHALHATIAIAQRRWWKKKVLNKTWWDVELTLSTMEALL
jgi:hypothetical protein